MYKIHSEFKVNGLQVSVQKPGACSIKMTDVCMPCYVINQDQLPGNATARVGFWIFQC